MFNPSWVVEVVNATNATFSVTDIVSVAMSNPNVAIAIGIEIILGAGLGYIMAKMAKYILAFIALLIVGAVLNVWSLGGSIEDFLVKIGITAAQFKDVILGFISTLGLLMVGPVTFGFFIGLIIGLLKK
ncbi:MAG: hypothetical protein DRO14_05140 [Thermoprotei archaeon]|nr:MAG: hypothetical protein DRO14_05140 [Thermoprotei archaeon]